MKIELSLKLLFDSNEIWGSIEQFESDFSKLLEVRGLIAERIQCADDENYYCRTIYISKSKQEIFPHEKMKPPVTQKKDVQLNVSK